MTKYITVGGPVVPGLCTVAREWYPVDTGKREDEGQGWSCFSRMLGALKMGINRAFNG